MWPISLVVVFFFKQETAYALRISYWSSDVCSSDLPIAFTARWKLAIAAPYLAMRAHGAGDSSLGWRGIPSRTQTQVCIRAPFLSFVPSGPVLQLSLSARLVHGRSDVRGYRKRPPQVRPGHGPVEALGSPPIVQKSCGESGVQYVLFWA